MIPIYICEDEKEIREHIVDVINKYIVIQNYDMEIALASHNPEDILAACKENATRGIYFFDVDLKNDTYNGFQLAKEIRKLDTRGFITFITTHGELTFETFRYRVEAMDYIVKDEVEHVSQRIQTCLDSIQDRIHNDDFERDTFYTVKILDRIHNVPINEILFFETSPLKHRIILHAFNEELEFFGNLGEIDQSLGKQFIRTHRSFLVNRSNIRTFYLADDKVELINGEYCALSRKAKKALKDEMKE